MKVLFKYIFSSCAILRLFFISLFLFSLGALFLIFPLLEICTNQPLWGNLSACKNEWRKLAKKKKEVKGGGEMEGSFLFCIFSLLLNLRFNFFFLDFPSDLRFSAPTPRSHNLLEGEEVFKKTK